MSDYMKSIVFAVALCIVCSLLLTAASTGLKGLQQRNMKVDRQKNILLAMGLLSEGQPAAPDRIESLYTDRVKSLWVDRQGRIAPSEEPTADHLPVYVHVEQDYIKAYVVPINTRGLWGEINGYLAIDNDGATIRGFTVYKHSETPGLGGEIESRWFRKNFENKKIVDASGAFVSIQVAKGAVDEVVPQQQRPNHVDGISGATLTGKYLSSGFRQILQEYEPMAIAFRQRKPRYLRVN